MKTFKKDENGLLLLTDQQACELYLDYFNNYLTTSHFASALNTTEDDARNIIERGKLAHEIKTGKYRIYR